VKARDVRGVVAVGMVGLRAVKMGMRTRVRRVYQGCRVL
jgi:hypothetical protein